MRSRAAIASSSGGLLLAALAGGFQALSIAWPGTGQAHGWLQVVSLALLASSLRRLAVPIHLERRVETSADIGAEFDDVVIAVGARARDLPEEFAQPNVMNWWTVLSEGAPAPTGQGHALMVDDGTGFWWNYGVAEALVVAGWTVTYVTPATTVGYQIPVESMAPLLARLGRGDTRFRILTQLFDLDGSNAQLIDMTSGAVDEVAYDLAVLQTGREPVRLAEEAAFGSARVHRIGDCVAARRMANAVFDAQQLGMAL